MSAIISDCGRYRYRLERKPVGSGNGSTLVIMVNPSTADAELDDPTIRKLKGFAVRYKWGKIIVGNLFAWRTPNVAELATVADPRGPANNMHLEAMIREADTVIVAWGASAKLPKKLRGRWRTIYDTAIRLGKQPYSLGPPLPDGHPRHPCMLGYDNAPQPWAPPL